MESTPALSSSSEEHNRGLRSDARICRFLAPAHTRSRMHKNNSAPVTARSADHGRSRPESIAVIWPRLQSIALREPKLSKSEAAKAVSIDDRIRALIRFEQSILRSKTIAADAQSKDSFCGTIDFPSFFNFLSHVSSNFPDSLSKLTFVFKVSPLWSRCDLCDSFRLPPEQSEILSQNCAILPVGLGRRVYFRTLSFGLVYSARESVWKLKKIAQHLCISRNQPIKTW